MRITVTGDRCSGRTTLLINSIVAHLTDPRLKDDVQLIASAGVQSQNRNLFERILNELQARDVEVTRAVHTYLEIEVGKRKLRIVPAKPESFIGHQFDYVFLDNFDFMDKGFQLFMDEIIRPFVVVVQTNME